MTTPTIYKPETVAELVSSVACSTDGIHYVPCRPAGWGGISLRHRVRCAWLAFTGKVDLVQWEGQ